MTIFQKLSAYKQLNGLIGINKLYNMLILFTSVTYQRIYNVSSSFHYLG